MSFTNIKESVILLFKSNGHIPVLGVRCIYELPHSTTQLHFCRKTLCSTEMFLLSTLRYWSSFCYETKEEIEEDLDVCSFSEKLPSEAEVEYNSIIAGLCICEELVQKPPRFSELGRVERFLLISDKWNYRSIFLETESNYIGCHWDTSE